MNSTPILLVALKQLVRDTFRQSFASGIFWVMTAVTIVCFLFCLSIRVEGDVPLDPEPGDGDTHFLPAPTPRQLVPIALRPLASQDPVGALLWIKESKETLARPEYDPVKASEEAVVLSGRMTLLFGQMPIPLFRDRRSAVQFIQVVLAGGIADTLGVLLALVWTAGFLPSFLEASSASVLLAKPISRWVLLVGKYLGVVVFLGVQATAFVGLTWLALGLRTGVWNPNYLACIPLLILHFAIFFSFSTLLAVLARSTVVCVFGSIMFWMITWGLNYGRHMVLLTPEVSTAGGLRFLSEAFYWIMPKPLDLNIMLFDTVQASQHFMERLSLKDLTQKQLLYGDLSIATSVLATIGILALASWQFKKMDY